MVEKIREAKGFTLIELLIVVAIIAILAAIAIPQYAKYKERAAKASAVSDAKNIANSIEAYYADTGSYPDVGFTNTDVHILALDNGDTFTLSAHNTLTGGTLLSKTGYTFEVSNDIYDKSVTYDSTKGGLDASVWQ